MGQKYEAGMKMFDFTFNSPWNENLDFYQETEGRPCVLMFLRYYGCSTCQLEMHRLIQDYPKFAAKGAKVFVVLQSEPETLREQSAENYFPYTIICDPKQELYQACEIGSNPHPEIRSAELEKRVQEARALGIRHGKNEGNEAQSPATFVLAGDQTIRYAWYGVESIDVPANEELLNLL